MKKRFLSAALLCVLSVGVLAGCDDENEETKGGDVEYSISITNKDELGETWYVGDSARTVSVELSPTANATAEIASGNLSVESSAPSVIAATGLSLTAQALGSATITVNWHGATDSVALSVGEPTYESIASINKGLEAGTIQDGDTVRFYGKVVGGMEPSTTHLYSGVYLADGEDSLMLYSGNITNVFFEDGEQVINFGDDIAVAAEVSAYSGFYEFKPSYVVPLNSLATSYSVTAPSVWEISEAEWGELTYTDVGRLVKMELTYVDGAIESTTAHASINTTFGDSTSVTMYCNYHNGTSEMEALQEKISILDEGDKITITGVIGWHEGAQVCPQFIYVGGEVVTPSEALVVPNKPAPTTITISGESTVTIRETTTLSVTVDNGASRSVTWSSSDESIATVASGGVVFGAGIGTATITATSKIDTSVKGTFSITVGYITAPEAYNTETSYYLGFVRTSTPEGVYVFTGEMSSYYGAMSTTFSEGAVITYAPVTDTTGGCVGFNLSFTDSNGVTQYICMNVSGTNHNFGFSTTPYTLGYSEEYDTFTALDGTDVYYFGTYGTYETMSCSAISYAATSIPSHLYDVSTIDQVGTDEEEPVELSEGVYRLGVADAKAATYRWFTTISSNAGQTTTKWNSGVDVTVETSECTDSTGATVTGYAFKYVSVQYTDYITYAGDSSSGTKLGYSTTEYYWAYDEDSGAFIDSIEGDSPSGRFLGLQNGYEVLRAYAVSNLPTENNPYSYCVATLYHEAPSALEPLPEVEVPNLEVATSLEDGESYYLGAFSSDQYHLITGSTSSYKLDTTTDIEQAVTVKVTGNDTDGWTLTIESGTNVGKYIYFYAENNYTNLGLSDAETVPSSGTKVFSWDSQAQTLYTTSSVIGDLGSNNAQTSYTYAYFEYYNSQVTSYKATSSGTSGFSNAAHLYTLVED